MTDNSLEIKSYTLGAVHIATINAFAKDMGYPSASSALRRIIDEWVTLKASRLVDSRVEYVTEQA